MNINGAQLHLLINHFPVVGFPIVFLTFVWAFWRNESEVFLYGAYLTILIWILTLVSYFTGEGAEVTINTLDGFQIDLVHHHEDTAFIALIFGSVLALLSLGILPIVKRKITWLQEARRFRFLQFTLIFGVLILSLVFAYAAHQGGLIRHSEIR